MIYKELECKTALNKIKKPMLPYHWDLNIYRGCKHGCAYCFAMYSHEYLGETEYFDTIYYKKNILEVLEKELSAPKWKKEVINIGGITDSYQPIEKELGLMRGILQLMIKYKNPIIISTKSDLILRDIDLLATLSKTVTVNIAFTITTMDETVRTKLEPYGSSSKNRFRAVKQLKEKTNAIVGVHIMPIIPYLTSSSSNLNALYALSHKAKVDYVLPSSLYLRGKTQINFTKFFREYDKDSYLKFKKLYGDKIQKQEYKTKLSQKLHQLETQYGLTSDYQKVIEKNFKI